MTRKLIVAITVAVVLGVGATAAAAQGEPVGSDPATSGHQHRHHPRRAVLRTAAQAAADTIGVSTSELREALRSGQSIATLAESKGVAVDDVEQAIAAALNDSLERAVAEGRVGEERAAKLRERIPGFAERLVNHQPRRGHDSGEQT